MAEKEMQAMSRLRNPRTEEKPAPKGVDDGKMEEDEQGEPGAHEALESMHEAEPGAKHMVVSHDGYGMTSHGVDENGEHSGPHDHENMEALKSHMGKFFDEEENEGHGDAHEDALEDSGNLY